VKRLARAEHESPAREPDQFCDDAGRETQRTDDRRHGVVFIKPGWGAAAHGTLVHVAQRCGDGAWIDGRVRIHKKETLALGGASSGIARGGNLSMIHAHDTRVVLPGDFRRRIRRGIVHHDDFMRLADDAGGFMNRLQRAAQARLFIVRGNDEGNHGSLEIGQSTTNCGTRESWNGSESAGGARLCGRGRSAWGEATDEPAREDAHPTEKPDVLR